MRIICALPTVTPVEQRGSDKPDESISISAANAEIGMRFLRKTTRRNLADDLKIGAHHIRDAAYLGVTPNIIDRCFPLRTCLLQNLQNNIESDFVSVFEAICEGLGYAIDI